MTTRSFTTLTLRAIVAAASVAAALGAGHYAWSWWRTARDRQSTEDAYVRGDLTTVGPQVAGYVSSLLVRDNERVGAGQVLLTIDDRDYRARADHARAAVAQARADAAQLARRETLQLAVIREADAAVAQARVERDFARRDLERSSRLLTDGFIAPSRHDAARTGAERASAALARADAAAGAARDQLAVIRSESAQIAAREAQAKAGLRLAQIALDNTIVRAPISGVVGNRRVEAGEYVRPGSALLAIVPLDGVWVEANFKETQLTRMAPGQRVRVTVDSFPGTLLRGTVDSLSPGSGAAFSLLPPDNATGNFVRVVQRVPVKIRLDVRNALLGRLVPGLSAHVTVDVARGAPERYASAAR